MDNAPPGEPAPSSGRPRRNRYGGASERDSRGRGGGGGGSRERNSARGTWEVEDERGTGNRDRRRRDHAPPRGAPPRRFEQEEGENFEMMNGERSTERRGRYNGGRSSGGYERRGGWNESWEREDVRGRGSGDSFHRGSGGRGRGEYDRNGGGDDWGERTAAPTELQRTLAAVDMDLVYGVAPVLGALRSGRRKARTLYVQERKEGSGSGPGPARKEGHNAAVAHIHRMAAALDVPVKNLPKGDLNVLSRDRPHQGYVLHATPLDYEDVADVGNAPEAPAEAGAGAAWTDAPVWLVLDEVSDPQNLGALARSAHFLGAKGVVACRRNSSALTPAVSKASAGAVESMAIRGVASMPRFLRRAKEQGWRVVGAAVSDDAVTTGGLEVGVPTLLVLGSEGRGLRPMVRAECDVLARIGGRSGDVVEEAGVDSLNVSVAGAILLHRLLGV